MKVRCVKKNRVITGIVRTVVTAIIQPQCTPDVLAKTWIPQGKRVFVRIIEVNQWSQKIVPAVEKLEERHGRQGRFGQGQDDSPQDSGR